MTSSSVRCSELWYEDGNVVFDARGTMFRVYRGILIANSPLFADMFSFPQPRADPDTCEGCPLIRVSDEPEEFKFFLKAIHDASFYVQDVPNPYPVVVAILRLASKYDVQYLRARAIHQLTHDFPTTLAEFNAVFVNDVPKLIQEPVNMLDLADRLREADVLAPLPCVLRHVCYHAPDPPIDFILDSPMCTPNIRACIRGLYALKRRKLQVIAELLHIPVPQCSLPSQCQSTTRQLWDYEAASSTLHKLAEDPEWDATLVACDECGMEWFKHTGAEEQAAWDALPEIFGLPPWDELRAAAH